MLPLLGLVSPVARMRVQFNVAFDYITSIPGTPVGTEQYQSKQRERLLASLRRLAGENATYEGTHFQDRQAHVTVHAYPVVP